METGSRSVVSGAGGGGEWLLLGTVFGVMEGSKIGCGDDCTMLQTH